MRSRIPLDEVKAAIRKTGFPLEHLVSEKFKNKGWSVISNRYYVDDVDGRARELDLVVYKAIKSSFLEVVTVLLVSCKKDAEKTWVSMSRDRPAQDPNHDWSPLHLWTDEEPLRTVLEGDEWREDYLATVKEISKALVVAERDIFAFQEVAPKETQSSKRKDKTPDKTTTAVPRNDAAIFNAVTGLMKALDFEISALPKRVSGRQRLYIFSLAVIVDAPLVDVRYSINEETAFEVERLLHLARYMVRGQHFSSLIHLVRSDVALEFIEDMTKLATENATYFGRLENEAYSQISTNHKICEYLKNSVREDLLEIINAELEAYAYDDRATDVEFWFTKKELHLELDISIEAASTLNRDNETKALVSSLFSEKMRFTGSFSITCDVPF